MILNKRHFYIEQYGPDRYVLVATYGRLAARLNKSLKRYPAATAFNQYGDEALFILTWQQLSGLFSVLGIKELSRPAYNE